MVCRSIAGRLFNALESPLVRSRLDRELRGPSSAARVAKLGGAAGPSDFVFARLRYDSGDWDYNPKVCANVLDAVVQYTRHPRSPG